MREIKENCQSRTIINTKEVLKINGYGYKQQIVSVISDSKK